MKLVFAHFATGLIAGAVLAGCSDETISGYLPTKSDWVLSQVNGGPFDASFAVRFPRKGRITGTGDCVTFAAHQTAPYPWFDIDNVSTILHQCDDPTYKQADELVIDLLTQMTLAEVSGSTLILSDDDGSDMLFIATQN